MSILTVRLSDEEMNQLKRVATRNGKKLSELMRELIAYGMQNIDKPPLDRVHKTQIRYLFEILSMVRSIAEQVDNSIHQKAEKFADTAIEAYFEDKV